ncbi:putative zinc finger protein [Orchesella cincta]|uniref:Putative zinc finger protein n=1 Tax=Orchesella cincta TaxID=48709 RepID=A0A1D2M527_ORCCI|nr:putative zinc finger protein [Orchesella cincta]
MYCQHLFTFTSFFRALLEFFSAVKGQEKILDCFICSISFKQQHLLDDHVRRHHTREEPFVCRTCDKSFSTQRSVTSHKRVTHGNSRFACSKCSATYKRKDYLKRHVILKHGKNNNDSLVKCLDPDCDKVFLYPSSMKTHHEVYHQEMTSRFKYRCTECDTCL